MDTTLEVITKNATVYTPLSVRKATESVVQVKDIPQKLYVKNTYADELSFEEFWDEFRLFAASLFTAGKTLTDPLGICTELYGKDFVMPPPPNITVSRVLDKKPPAMVMEI